MTNIDTNVIRPQVRAEDIQLRGQGISPARLQAIKKGLLALHSLGGRRPLVPVTAPR